MPSLFFFLDIVLATDIYYALENNKKISNSPEISGEFPVKSVIKKIMSIKI